jgi:hypothetical protein
MKRKAAMPGDRLSQLARAVALGLLGGCAMIEGPVGTATTGASAVLLINTGKTLTDHAISYITDEDCGMVNYERDRHYCKPWPDVIAHTEPELYCYRTLAQVECHAKPEPYGNKETLVGIRPAWPAPAVPAPAAK